MAKVVSEHCPVAIADLVEEYLSLGGWTAQLKCALGTLVDQTPRYQYCLTTNDQGGVELVSFTGNEAIVVLDCGCHLLTPHHAQHGQQQPILPSLPESICFACQERRRDRQHER